MPKEAKETVRREYSDLASELGAALEGSEPEPEKKEEPPPPPPEPEPEAAKSEPPPPPEPSKPTIDADEQAERTKLGRRVKKLEDLIGDLVTELRESRKAPEKQGEPLPEVISTPQDVLRVVSAAKEEEKKQVQSYQLGYRKAIDKLGEENADIHQEVLKEILAVNSPYNGILSDDPFADAERNYYRAAKSVLKKKAGVPVQPKANVRGEKPITPTGVSVGAPTPTTPKKAIKLDEYSKLFMKRMNLSDDWAEKAIQE